MFSKGDMVVYGRTGVCSVEDICERKFSEKNTRLYYRLRPIYQHNNVIYAPVDSELVFMRRMLSREQAEELVESIPEIRRKALDETDTVDTVPDCRSCAALAAVAIRLYNRKTELRKSKKKLGLSEEKRLKTAEELLFGELAAVFEIPIERVPELLFSGKQERKQ